MARSSAFCRSRSAMRSAGSPEKRSVVMAGLLQGVVYQLYRRQCRLAIRAAAVHVVADMTLRLDHRGAQLLALGLVVGAGLGELPLELRRLALQQLDAQRHV